MAVVAPSLWLWLWADAGDACVRLQEDGEGKSSGLGTWIRQGGAAAVEEAKEEARDGGTEVKLPLPAVPLSVDLYYDCSTK
jgi:hypothetical protein